VGCFFSIFFFLQTHPPPPPPAAGGPPAPGGGAGGRAANLTLREIFEQHRSNPDCSACHAKLDPLGFALENYGPTGVWRDTYDNGREVDSAGLLFGRYEFDNIVEFKDAILAEKDRFARAFAAHLMAFALGRAVEASDQPALDRIVRETAPEGFRIQDMIRQIVLSEPFQRKHAPAKLERAAL
ncbi:MAG: DUF1585 domain-containing protein, partial [Acidobacteriia bacterium]|nr:DUF1585 domain-containing protein [Terriglobia bacterium]